MREKPLAKGRRPGESIPTQAMQKVLSEARKTRDEREAGYREQSLRIHPWVCGRCSRSFTSENISELTVHHKDHNHNNNPPDGSNWENLCLYCHDNEHSRYTDHLAAGGLTLPAAKDETATYKAFADLKAHWERKRQS